MKDWVRGRLNARRAGRVLNRAPQDTGLGFQFAGPRIMARGDFEMREVQLLKLLLKDADLFVNVGANYGYFVCLAQTIGLPTIAVEPVPVNYEVLKRNIKINGYEDFVEVFNCACGAEPGVAEIFGVGTGASLVSGWAKNPKSLSHTIDVRRLDDILASREISDKTVLLVDVEGFELEVLKGAEGLLSGPAKPRWILESGFQDLREDSEINQNFVAVFDLFTAAGYQFHCIAAPERLIDRDLLIRSLDVGEDLIGGYNFLLAPMGSDVSDVLN